MVKIKKFRFNKLVRDNVPSLLSKKKIQVTSKKLEPQDFLNKLQTKFTEELNELIQAQTPTEIAEELADLLELIYAYAKHKKIALEKIEQIRQKKVEISGPFNNQLYIESIALPEDHLEINRFLLQPTKYPEIKDLNDKE